MNCMMNFSTITMFFMIFGQTVVESYRIGEVKRGGSNPSRAFFLLREFQNLQQRLHYNRRITVRQRRKLPKNGQISDLFGQNLVKSERNKSRKRFIVNFHNFSSTLNKISEI